jgi:hypothetical protein
MVVKWDGDNPWFSIPLSDHEAWRLLNDPDESGKVKDMNAPKDATQELIERIQKAQHEAAALYGVTPEQWDRMDYRARTLDSSLSHKELAIYEQVLNKASEIMRGGKVYR